MKSRKYRVAALACLVLLAACDGTPQGQGSAASKPETTAPRENPHTSKDDPMKLTMPADVTPATMIAYAGHGQYFDHLARPIKVDDKLILTMETSMSGQLAENAQLEDSEAALLKDAQAYALSGELKPAYAALLQGAVTSRLMQFANKAQLAKLEWRHRLLMRHYTHLTIDKRWVRIYPVRLRSILDYLGPWVVIQPSTDYVARCRADNVPIPPQWSEANPNGWVHHGLLAQNLLSPGAIAHLWTWADPHQEGGCIMLPRGNGVGGLAGTICQSKTSGRACFWDNKDRTTGAVLGWSNVTLNVNQMQDGDMLAENCTGCHRGNNVFLISPDDPTWALALRPAPGSAIGSTFTTNIASTITRYTPISNQSGWANQSGSQCLGCHERPTVGFTSQPSPMPPACAGGSTSDPSACYN